MKASKILIKAQKYVKKGWTKHVSARDKQGNHIHARSKKAVRWCAVGSVWTATSAPYSTPAFKFLKEAIVASGSRARTVASWNDAKFRTKKQVLVLFNKAIELAKAAND